MLLVKPPSSLPAQTLAALLILPTLLMAIRSLILILITLSVPASWTAPGFTALLGTPSTGLVPLFQLRRLTTCTSIPVLYTRQTAAIATAEGPSAVWLQIRFSNYPPTNTSSKTHQLAYQISWRVPLAFPLPLPVHPLTHLPVPYLSPSLLTLSHANCAQ